MRANLAAQQQQEIENDDADVIAATHSKTHRASSSASSLNALTANLNNMNMNMNVNANASNVSVSVSGGGGLQSREKQREHERELLSRVGDQLTAMSLDHQQQQLITAGNKMRVWSIVPSPGNKARRGGPAHDAAITNICYSPIFQQLVSIAVDGVVRVWELASGRNVFEFTASHEGELHDALQRESDTSNAITTTSTSASSSASAPPTLANTLARLAGRNEIPFAKGMCLCICMYVYAYVYMHVCMYAYVYMHVCMRA